MTDTAAPNIDTATDLPIRRPHANQYLAGNYAAVDSEVTAHDLPVVHHWKILLRTGQNPLRGAGQGIVRSQRLKIGNHRAHHRDGSPHC